MARVPHAELRADARAAQVPLVFDGRNLYDLDWMRELGFAYYSIGRPTVTGPGPDEAHPTAPLGPVAETPPGVAQG